MTTPQMQPMRDAEQSYPAQRAALMDLFNAALDAVSARAAMPRHLPTAARGRTVLLSIGKAADAMARVALERIGAEVTGLVVTRYGHLEPGPRPQGLEVIEAGHPVPDNNSQRAAQRALEMAHGLTAHDQLLVLLSGGGSALMSSPAPGVSLADKQAVTRTLLQSGATIGEINCVRKHISRIKGGRLAQAAGPAKVTTLIISDVPGDDPSFVSSGPTTPDATTLEMAREILHRYGVAAPPSVTAALDDPSNETPVSDSLGLAGAETLIIARARDALAAAAKRAEAMGFVVSGLGDQLQAEARHLGASHAALARRLGADGKPRAIISGGETTVTVTNKAGRGGRNLEYLLGLAIALQGAPDICALACDTDGIDGTDDAAGAIVLPDTLVRAKQVGVDPVQYLRANNAYAFFEALGDLVITGPTRTNVNDFRAILVGGPATRVA
ncbi:glycerate kinase [Caulobacter sp. 1776]|uniref:glycerate kinase type-2 family protein n=1 Tax=Caulobacter sp. 1776 TaxID=3156420 RepID=UPI00339A20D1